MSVVVGECLVGWPAVFLPQLAAQGSNCTHFGLLGAGVLVDQGQVLGFNRLDRVQERVDGGGGGQAVAVKGVLARQVADHRVGLRRERVAVDEDGRLAMGEGLGVGLHRGPVGLALGPLEAERGEDEARRLGAACGELVGGAAGGRRWAGGGGGAANAGVRGSPQIGK
jgi:hypothetical protein